MESVAISEELIRSYEKRRSGRETFVCKGLLYRDNRVGRPLRVNMKDISQLGVGFETARPVEAGTRCRIQIELGPTRISWQLRVVCCGKIAENLYRLGCEFVPLEPPLFDLGNRELELGNEEQVLVLQ
jgi:hypothetical protein